MLESIITSKTRIKLLLKFFLNSETRSYLRNLEQEFGESTNAIRVELNRLEEAGLLRSEMSGNKKYFSANRQHPLFNDIHNMLKKTIGIDKLIERVISQVGDLEQAYLTGDFARGKDSGTVELVLVGNALNTEIIDGLIARVRQNIQREILYSVVSKNEVAELLSKNPSLLIWDSRI